MARITVDDCIDKVDGHYELVLIAKERTVQLNSGEQPKLSAGDDKNTVLALREIAEEKISVKELEDSAINKLRKHVEPEPVDSVDENEPEGDDFENTYKGEVSKSGVPILPSKRARKIPEKIYTSTENKQDSEEGELETDEVSLENLQEEERDKEDVSNEEESGNINN